MRKIKNILILAGGDSSRFWPLENKILWSFLDQPLINHLTSDLLKYGENIFIVTNKVNLTILNKLVNKNIRLITQNEKFLGMGGAILSCKNKFHGEVLIVNGCDVFNPTLINQLINQLKSRQEMILVAKRYKDYFPGGYMKFVNNHLSAIIEKPGKDNIPSDRVRLVCDYFTDYRILTKSLESVKTATDNWYEVSINQMLKQGLRTTVLNYDDYLFTLKFPWHILLLSNFFLKKITKNHIGKRVKISSTAVIVPPVHFSNDVQVGDFAKVVGPCYIGQETTIADHTIVNQSHIGNNCLIGGYSEVTRSYLGNQVMLHRNYIGDSVIDEKVIQGAGAATANFRFDGQPVKSVVAGYQVDSGLIKFGTIIGSYSKIGVNATILPGVKIGRNTFIGPGEVVCSDVEDNQFIFKSKRIKNKQII